MAAASRLGVPENGRQQAEHAARLFAAHADALRGHLLWFLEQPLSMSSAERFTKLITNTADNLDTEARTLIARAGLHEALEPERVPLLREGFSIHSVIDEVLKP